MIKVEVIIPQNDTGSISEGLKKIGVGGLMVSKIRGRGKKTPPQVQVGRGTDVYTPEFGDKYVIDVIVSNDKEQAVIRAVRDNSRFGMIFVYPVSRAIDIATGEEGEHVI